MQCVSLHHGTPHEDEVSHPMRTATTPSLRSATVLESGAPGDTMNEGKKKIDQLLTVLILAQPTISRTYMH